MLVPEITAAEAAAQISNGDLLAVGGFGPAGSPKVITPASKFASPDKRNPNTTLPEGLTRDEYFNLVNVDPPNHYFKTDLVMPWLERIVKE